MHFTTFIVSTVAVVALAIVAEDTTPYTQPTCERAMVMMLESCQCDANGNKRSQNWTQNGGGNPDPSITFDKRERTEPDFDKYCEGKTLEECCCPFAEKGCGVIEIRMKFCPQCK